LTRPVFPLKLFTPRSRHDSSEGHAHGPDCHSFFRPSPPSWILGFPFSFPGDPRCQTLDHRMCVFEICLPPFKALLRPSRFPTPLHNHNSHPSGLASPDDMNYQGSSRPRASLNLRDDLCSGPRCFSRWSPSPMEVGQPEVQNTHFFPAVRHNSYAIPKSQLMSCSFWSSFRSLPRFGLNSKFTPILHLPF